MTHRHPSVESHPRHRSDAETASAARPSRDDRLEWSTVTLASIGEGVVAIDPEGRVTFVNPVAERLSGWTIGEALGRPLGDVLRLVDEGTRAPVTNPGLRLLRDAAGPRCEGAALLLERSGGERPIEITAATIRAGDGDMLGCVSVFRDVSEPRRMERELAGVVERERRARAEAEGLARMNEEFLATLSHELRSPLNAILGWIQILRRDPRAERLNQGLAVLERSARLQAQLVGDMVDMSRIRLGKLRLELQHVDFGTLVEAAIAAVEPTANARGVVVERAPEESTGPVHADPSRLQQVVWNLLTNAVKFTPSGGRVRVGVRRSGADVELVVQDTGQGIPGTFLPHVFERFRQADGASAREHGGLGLGLAIVKQLVELHGGSVAAESDGEGRGATFRVRLPADPAARG